MYKLATRFYELRQRDQTDFKSSGQEDIDMQDGNKVKLAVIRDRIIVAEFKCIDTGETNLSAGQIMRRASYVFKRLFATGYNL